MTADQVECHIIYDELWQPEYGDAYTCILHKDYDHC